MQIGIIGLPNVGKSTLFKAITNKQVDIQNYPFTTIEPNIGIVSVPDERVEKLAQFSNSKNKVHTTIEFIDIAGLVKDAAQGEGLGNKFLSHIREVNAIIQVVRAFKDDNVTHIHNIIDPANDISIVNTELILADLETVERRIENITRRARAATTEGKNLAVELGILESLRSSLKNGYFVSSLALDDNALDAIQKFNLLTGKKIIYAINVSEDQLVSGWQPNKELLDAVEDSEYIVINNKLELVFSTMPFEEKKELLEEFKLSESNLDQLIKKSYKILDLITFFSSRPDETRAWTTRRGNAIDNAVRIIHTDFEKQFIRADVINWQTLIDTSSWADARTQGSVHTVGRNYIVQDGDVVEVKV